MTEQSTEYVKLGLDKPPRKPPFCRYMGEVRRALNDGDTLRVKVTTGLKNHETITMNKRKFLDATRHYSDGHLIPAQIAWGSVTLLGDIPNSKQTHRKLR